jgi:hypothetical protein
MLELAWRSIRVWLWKLGFVILVSAGWIVLLFRYYQIQLR